MIIHPESQRRAFALIGLLSLLALMARDAVGAETETAAVEPEVEVEVLALISAPHSYVTVIDGDTLIVGGVRVRLWGVDAPEIEQLCRTSEGDGFYCGVQAKQALQLLIDRQTVVCEPVELDRYGRTVARCKVADDLDLAGLMVELGMAFDWPKYSEGRYAGHQALAKENRLGLWEGSFELPWDFRNARRRSAKDGAT